MRDASEEEFEGEDLPQERTLEERVASCVAMSAELGSEIDPELMRETIEEMDRGDIKMEVFPISEPSLRDVWNIDGAYNPYCGLRQAFREGGLRGFFGVVWARRPF